MQEEIVTPDKHSDKGKKEQVQEMFDTISPAYDGLNRVMTLRMDISWRKRVREKVAQIKAGTILDVATGTGDLAIELSKIEGAHITGVDISQGMLSVGEKKIKELGLSERISMQLADSENLPFADGSFDAVTVSFGVRNFENLQKGLSELRRVLRPGGRSTLYPLCSASDGQIFGKEPKCLCLPLGIGSQISFWGEIGQYTQGRNWLLFGELLSPILRRSYYICG